MDKKRNLWPLLFIGIFGFTLYMIGWTIYQSKQIATIEDDAFLSKYQNIDEHYNKIVESNAIFLSKYAMFLKSNNKEIELDFKDIFLRQAAKNKAHNDIFKTGDNNISIVVKNKNGEFVSDATIKAHFSSSTSDAHKQILENFTFANNAYYTVVKTVPVGNFNLTGEVIIGQDKGYFYIKTNAISK